MEHDFVDDEFAANRSPEPPRTESERLAQATSMLAGVSEARREGRVPSGSYEWVEVFDLSGLGDGFDGTRLPDNIFDGPRDRWYVVTDHGLVEWTVPAG